MSSSIYKLVASVCLVMMAIPAFSKDNNPLEKADIPFYQGIQLGIEMGGPARMLFSENWSTSAKMDINLKNKYFPTVEVGLANFDKTGQTGIRFTSTGTFAKVGLNLPLTIHGDKAQDMFYGGLHYGISSFSYTLENLTFSGGYWDQDITTSLNEKAMAGWFEAIAGVRVKVLGPISLGWSIHYKSTLHVSNGDHSIPPYIPGYGDNVKPNASICGHLYYKLPF